MQLTGLAGKRDPRQIMNLNLLDQTTGVGPGTVTTQSVHDLLPIRSFDGFERNAH